MLRRPVDIGRLIARVLCAVFALVGAVPLAGAAAIRSRPVLEWASRETARVLAQELGVHASYRVELQLLPLRVALKDVVVPASDGGTPFLQAESVSVRPRVFSLLAGRLDVGDVEIVRPRSRVVIKEGKLANLEYRLPEARGPRKATTRAPFSSLGVTEAELELELEGMALKTGPVDIDVYAENGPSFEVGVRAAETAFKRQRQVTIPPKKPASKARAETEPAEPAFTFTAEDDDVVCQLDLRARIEPNELLVRRLTLVGMADVDPGAGTAPKCSADNENEPNHLALRLSQLRVQKRAGEVPSLDGHVVLRAPVGLTNRFVRMPGLFGWVAFAGDVRYDGHSRLPEVRGRLRGADIQLDIYHLAKRLDASIELSGDHILIPRMETGFAEGTLVVTDARIDPLEKGAPLTAARVDGSSVNFSAMMRDLGVTPNTIVAWSLDKTRVTKVHGTLAPLHLDAEMAGESHGFEVYDRAYHDPAKRHMIGVRSANLKGKIGVRPDALEFYDTRASFGKSSVVTKLVSIGFHNDLVLEVAKGSKLDLADVSPIIDIPMAGSADVSAKMAGKANDPLLNGDVAIQKLEFGGFPLGDIKNGKVRFRPLKLDFLDVHGRKGKSDFAIPTARLDFEAGASVVVDATAQADKLDIRDFFAMFGFDQDPRFDPIHGAGKVDTRIHYVLGGPKDHCGGGYLDVAANVDFRDLDLFDERYDAGRADFEFRWVDREASYLGIELDVPSVTLQKGSGTVLGSFSVRQGGVLSGQLVGTSVPLSKIDSMGSLALMVDGKGSGVAEISGSVDELAFNSHVRLSPLRVGSATLPASDLSIRLEPKKRPLKVTGRTRCGGAITPPFDKSEWDADPVAGTFHIDGNLFEKQIALHDVRVTRQRSKDVVGEIVFKNLDVGAMAELSPTVAASNSKTSGKLNGKLRIEQLNMDHAATAKGEFSVESLALEKSGIHAEIQHADKPLHLENGKLEIPGFVLGVRTSGGQEALFDVKGKVTELGHNPEVAASLTLRPMTLDKLATMIPRAERVKGTLSGGLTVSGPAAALRYQGGFNLDNAEVQIRGMPAPITDVHVNIAVDNDEIRLSQASARMGSGTLKITGSAPLRGFDLGEARAVITARQISVPIADGVKTSMDADLVAEWEPKAEGAEERSLPRVSGNVTLKSFEYTRPVVMTADIATLTQRGKRTEFEAYDPADDFVQFDIKLRSTRALKISNNLIEADLLLDEDGLQLAGTNQRFGLRGDVKLKPGGRIRMRRNEFEIRQGVVRFDDVTRIAPQVDVTATTEYRRYHDVSTADKGSTASSTTSSTSSSTTSTGTAGQGGRWRITMRAHGDADKLKIDLTSDPALAQDDIFLLLTVGLTRAELDQAQSASVGESVALEALGTLSGADKAVTEAVPVIDEFRFGSAYSSRTGRTEPTVTIGKRLAQRIRANVTSGLAESREIRSNLEWQLNQRLSVEGSYDNVNDISSSSLGNLGADIRWRLEFE